MSLPIETQSLLENSFASFDRQPESTSQWSEAVAKNRVLDAVSQGKMVLEQTPQVTEGVDLLQSQLRYLDYEIQGLNESNRGIFGPATKLTVQKFQMDNGLEPTGRVDQQTLLAIDTAYQKKAQEEGVRFVDAAGPITFANDNASNPSPNLPVADECAAMVEQVVAETGLRININSTTGGQHAPTSNHYKARAVDINEINGQSVSNAENLDNAEKLQNAFDKNENINENFGPALKHKKGKDAWVSGHQDHIHISCSPKKI